MMCFDVMTWRSRSGCAGFRDRCPARDAGNSRHSRFNQGELQLHGFYGFHGSLLGIDSSVHQSWTTWRHAWRDHLTRRAPKQFMRGAFGDRSAVRHPGQSV